MAAGLLTIGLVTAGAAAVMAPYLATPPRAAVVPDRFDPSVPPPSASVSPVAVRGDPPIVQVGAAVPVVDGPAVLGYVTVTQYRTEAIDATTTRLFVEVAYVAVGSFDVTPTSWIATPLAGEAATPEHQEACPLSRRSSSTAVKA